jgi:site-specific DNA recombinase
MTCMDAPIYNAIIYTRVSNDTHEGRSVDDQERECRAECERRKWPVRRVFSDNNISASRYGGSRPAWERLKRELRKGDVLVTWEASRSARDVAEHIRLRDVCEELGVPLSYSGRLLDLADGDDRFFGVLDAAYAERESEQISKRTLRGKSAGALAGRPAGRVPWGYRVTSPGVWEIDEPEAVRIRTAVDRILAGEPHNSVFKWLQATEGYVPPSLTVMCRSLRKPSLAGLRVHRNEVVGNGTWEPILTKEQHLELVARLDRVRKIYGRLERPGPEPRHLLSHIAVCGGCGSGLSFRNRREGRQPVYVCPKGCCSRMAKPLDEAVEQELFDRLEKIDPAKFEDEDDGSATNGLWAEVTALEDQLAEYTDQAIALEITASSFAKIEQGITKKIEALKAQAAQADGEPVDLADLLANWAEMPVREKRAVIRGYFRVTVNPGKRGTKLGLGGVDVTPL